MNDSLSQILTHKIVAIIRGARPGDVRDIAEALYKGGVKCLEITLNSADALQVIKNISSGMGERLLVGAGTVLTAAEANDAIAAGAKFIISPVMSMEISRQTKELGAISIPGAFTPTEIFNAYNNGADIVKVFPGVSGPGFIKEVLAPLPYIPLMPTGGISLGNITAFKKAGAVAFGIGKSLVDTSQQMNETSLQAITTNAYRFMEVVMKE